MWLLVAAGLLTVEVHGVHRAGDRVRADLGATLVNIEGQVMDGAGEWTVLAGDTPLELVARRRWSEAGGELAIALVVKRAAELAPARKRTRTSSGTTPTGAAKASVAPDSARHSSANAMARTIRRAFEPGSRPAIVCADGRDGAVPATPTGTGRLLICVFIALFASWSWLARACLTAPCHQT